MDENQITKKTAYTAPETDSADNAGQTDSTLETAEKQTTETSPATTDTSTENTAGSFSEDTTTAKRMSAFDTPAASDAYETASTAATTPASSAFEMKNSVVSSPVNYYSAPDSTTNTSTAAAKPAVNSDFYTNAGSNNTTETPKGFAIASLVMGIGGILTSCCCGVGTIFCILGIIFGCVQQKDQNGQKPGMAIAGIIISIVGLLLSVLAILYFVIVGATTT